MSIEFKLFEFPAFLWVQCLGMFEMNLVLTEKLAMTLISICIHNMID